MPKTEKIAGFLFSLGVILFAIVMFRSVLGLDAVLFSTDDNIGALALRKAALPSAFFGWWTDSVLVGMAWDLSINWSNLLLWLLPVRLFTSWYHAIDLAIASVFLSLYLRARGRSWAACAIGVLTAFWVGSNLTLTFAGHMGKFAVLMFAAAFLWLCEMAVRSRKLGWSLLAGGAIGAMFLEQPDLALFFCIALGPFALYTLAREHGLKLPVWLRVLIPMGIVAALLALPSVLSAYQNNVKGVAVGKGEDANAQWEFATQWSWPPDESVDFIAPGYMGWRSGEPEGPYWGRMGRSAGWEQTKQGFQNFKLESQYLGVIPLSLALIAACGAWLGWRKDRVWSRELLFWFVVAVGTLLLSFGKYFPLYKLVYMLPAFSSIRNPNKFLQVFQLATAVLAASGLDIVARRPAWVAELATLPLRRVPVVLVSMAVVLLVWAFSLSTSWITMANQLSMSGWGAAADAIVRNQVHGAWIAVLMAVVVAVVVWVMWRMAAGRREVVRTAGAWVLVAVVMVDALVLSTHYVKPMRMDSFKEDGVITFLKANTRIQRIALLSQASFYNHWLTYTFPYHGISAINVTQMPRMPDDYKAFLGRIGDNPLRLWQLFGVGFVVGPVQGWTQIQNDPVMKNLFDLVYAFNIVPSGTEGFQAVPATQAQPGQHCILRMKAEAPRYSILAGWSVEPDSAALQKLASPDYPLFSKAIISPDTADGLPQSTGQGTCGIITVKHYRPGYVVLQASAEQTAILRIAEKYNREWKAMIDGEPAPVRRCDYLFQGVVLTPGLHEVILRFSAPVGLLLVQMSGFVLCALAMGLLMVGRRKPEPGHA